MEALLEVAKVLIPAAVIVLVLAGVLMVNRAALMQGDLLVKAVTAMSAVILAGVLAGLGLFGIDLRSALFGAPWNSPLPQTRGIIALEGIAVTTTLLLGGLFLGGALTLLKGRRQTRKVE